MATHINSESLREGDFFSIQQGEDASVWKVDPGEQTASLVCNHGEEMEYMHLDDVEFVYLLTPAEVEAHSKHEGFNDALGSTDDPDRTMA